MDSVLPTLEDMKRQEKLMRRIRVAYDVDTNFEPLTPRQQKKSDKALLRIISDSAKNCGTEKH